MRNGVEFVILTDHIYSFIAFSFLWTIKKISSGIMATNIEDYKTAFNDLFFLSNVLIEPPKDLIMPFETRF
jgi:hypothetical protein